MASLAKGHRGRIFCGKEQAMQMPDEQCVWTVGGRIRKTRCLLLCNDFLSCRGSLKQYKPAVSVDERALYCEVFEAKNPHLSFIWDPSLMQGLNWYHSGTKWRWFPFLQAYHPEDYTLRNNILTEHISVFSDGTQHIHRVRTSTS